MIGRRALIAAGAPVLVLAAAGPAAVAQQAADLPRIAYVANMPPDDRRVQAFRQGLQDVGFTDRENVVVELFLMASFDEVPAVVPRVLASQPDVIVSLGTPTTRALKEATTTIPVVFANVTDPVGSGLIDSLARPGGNVTGISLNNADFAGKTLEFLLEIVPKTAPIPVLYNPSNEGSSQPQVDEILTAAAALGVNVTLVAAEGTDDWDAVAAGLKAHGAQALLFTADLTYRNNFSEIMQSVNGLHLPAIFATSVPFVEAGALISYGPPPNWNETFAAAYVGRILQGTNPRDMPVEQPREFELGINRRTAEALGLTIPESLLLRATEVIE